MATQTFQTVLYDVQDQIATLTFNRPDNQNTLNPTMTEEILKILDMVDADDNVKALIITGAGRFFCAGADLSRGTTTFDYAKRADTPKNTGVHRDRGGLITLRLFDCLKPVIGAINGAAVGFGATVLLPMDLRLASTTSKFGYVFTRRGITLESAGAWFLPRVVPLQTAMEWSLTGRLIPVEEAHKAGLVRSVHPPEELMPAARALAREIIDNAAPVSVTLTRHMLWRMLSADHPMEAHQIDSRAVNARGAQADAKEGVASFLEKRKPNFTNTVSKDMPDFFPWWQPRTFK